MPAAVVDNVWSASPSFADYTSRHGPTSLKALSIDLVIRGQCSARIDCRKLPHSDDRFATEISTLRGRTYDVTNSRVTPVRRTASGRRSFGNDYHLHGQAGQMLTKNGGVALLG